MSWNSLYSLSSPLGGSTSSANFLDVPMMVEGITRANMQRTMRPPKKCCLLLLKYLKHGLESPWTPFLARTRCSLCCVLYMMRMMDDDGVQ